MGSAKPKYLTECWGLLPIISSIKFTHYTPDTLSFLWDSQMLIHFKGKGLILAGGFGLSRRDYWLKVMCSLPVSLSLYNYFVCLYDF